MHANKLFIPSFLTFNHMQILMSLGVYMTPREKMYPVLFFLFHSKERNPRRVKKIPIHKGLCLPPSYFTADAKKNYHRSKKRLHLLQKFESAAPL